MPNVLEPQKIVTTKKVFFSYLKGILNEPQLEAEVAKEGGNSKREIAIKAPKLSTLDSGAIDDFFREAKTAINFKHENILQCLGISFGLHTTFSNSERPQPILEIRIFWVSNKYIS